MVFVMFQEGLITTKHQFVNILLPKKYLAAADLDKKRYREELKALKSTDTYQETVRKKMCMMNNGWYMHTDTHTHYTHTTFTFELHCEYIICFRKIVANHA